MGLRSDVPVLGIRFDIDILDAQPGSYGKTAWATILAAYDIHQLKGAELFEGDTLLPNEYVYCIAVQTQDRIQLGALRSALEKSADFQKYADKARFTENVHHLPLVPAAIIDSAGSPTMLNHSLLRSALAAHEKQKRVSAASTQPPVVIPPRPSTPSARTRNLPDAKSVKEIADYLLANFRGASEHMFYVTPEELCDILNRYSSVAEAEWREYEFGSGDDIEVVLRDRHITKDGAGRETLNEMKFVGMGVFASNSDALAYLRDSIGVPKDAQLWGIRSRYTMNLMGGSSRVETAYPKDPATANPNSVTVDELWKRISERREAVGMSSMGSSTGGKLGCGATAILVVLLTMLGLGTSRFFI